MPRRQFRSVRDPALLGDCYVDFKSVPDPLTSGSMFGDDAAVPLEIEIGSGKGMFLSGVAPANPGVRFVGIEIVTKYAKLAAARVAKTGASNAVVIGGDAIKIIRDKVPDASVDAVHVYFPDPWWKKKHRERRVVTDTTIDQIERVIRPGGRLHFWTDVLDYFEDTIELIAQRAPVLGVPFPETVADASHELEYQTHFERRSRLNAIPVYRVRYQKRPQKIS